jgi:flagellar basal-body rod modification protein FlgD
MATSFDSTLASLGINRTTGTKATTTPDTSQQMDQSDFLALMTAQLKNQDPFAPVDNTQMVAQMAQLSQTSGIAEMNTTLKAISDRLGATTTSDMMAWVGRTVQVEGSTAYPGTGGGLSGSVDLGADASNVSVSIQNANGEVLKTVSLGPQTKGTIDFEWDGSTDSGDPAGAGPFTVKTSAQTADGKSVTATPLVWAPVTSVTMSSDGTPMLTLPGIGQVSANSVRKVG